MLPAQLEEKLEAIEKRYEEIQNRLSSQDVIRDREQFAKLSKDLKDIGEVVDLYRRYKKVQKDIKEAQELLKSREFEELAKEEIKRLKREEERIEKELKILMLPKDERDSRNVILEIRAGVGGEEAALFVADLLNMYQKYAEERGWKFSILSANRTGLGGYKEVIALIEGVGAYSRLKYESGVHRVQRIPRTESGGRIHTSTATVAVLP
ncbi:MAG: PCRF domain-containing protein, partial [Hydrogenobacter thermophilus]|nr:PCRF domain-containing protein [Hydrogenobacter thermophilus]